jgi:hypothetical protein
MYSHENELIGSISKVFGSNKISMIHITNRDSANSWSERYYLTDAQDSTATDTALFATYSDAGNIESKKIVSETDENIPITQDHIEIVTKEARKKYNKSLSEYQRVISNNDDEQIWYAFEELKLDRARWLAFRRDLYKEYKNEKIPPTPNNILKYSLNIESGIHTTGFCFAASEVIYRLNGKENWKVVSLKDPDHWNNGTPYFLKNRNSDEILDVTRNQYEERGIEIPYDLGKGRGLRNISNKAKTLSQMAGLGDLSK